MKLHWRWDFPAAITSCAVILENLIRPDIRLPPSSIIGHHSILLLSSLPAMCILTQHGKLPPPVFLPHKRPQWYWQSKIHEEITPKKGQKTGWEVNQFKGGGGAKNIKPGPGYIWSPPKKELELAFMICDWLVFHFKTSGINATSRFPPLPAAYFTSLALSSSRRPPAAVLTQHPRPRPAIFKIQPNRDNRQWNQMYERLRVSPRSLLHHSQASQWRDGEHKGEHTGRKTFQSEGQPGSFQSF